MRWLLLLCLAGCGVPSSAGPIMADQEFVDVYEANWIDEARVRRDALLQLCTDGFDLACVRVRDEQIGEYLNQ